MYQGIISINVLFDLLVRVMIGCLINVVIIYLTDKLLGIIGIQKSNMVLKNSINIKDIYNKVEKLERELKIIKSNNDQNKK